VLVVLLVGMIGFILWYVVDRRARNRLPGNPATRGVSGTTNTGLPAIGPAKAGPAAAGHGAPVDLAKHDGQTIDFSSGRPVVKDSAADQAAIEQATREMAEAVKGVTFGPPAKKAPPPEPIPPKKD